MKTFVFLIFVIFCIQVRADVGALFPENQAILLIQGKNEDAIKLYEAMNVDPDITNNVLTKHISYETMYAKPVFDLTCKRSQYAESASCTLKFFAPEAVVMKDQKSVLMGINDRFDAPGVAKLFNEISKNSYQAQVFQSENGKLKIWKTFDSSGNTVSFTMSYN